MGQDGGRRTMRNAGWRAPDDFVLTLTLTRPSEEPITFETELAPRHARMPAKPEGLGRTKGDFVRALNERDLSTLTIKHWAMLLADDLTKHLKDSFGWHGKDRRRAAERRFKPRRGRP